MTVTSYFRPEVKIQPFRTCVMHPAIIIGTVRSLWTRISSFFLNHSNLITSRFHRKTYSYQFSHTSLSDEQAQFFLFLCGYGLTGTKNKTIICFKSRLAAQKLEYRSARHEVRPVGIRLKNKRTSEIRQSWLYNSVTVISC